MDKLNGIMNELTDMANFKGFGESKEIINGVNVAGCKYFQIEANELYPKAHYCGSTFNRFCEEYPSIHTWSMPTEKRGNKYARIFFAINCPKEDIETTSPL